MRCFKKLIETIVLLKTERGVIMKKFCVFLICLMLLFVYAFAVETDDELNLPPIPSAELQYKENVAIEKYNQLLIEWSSNPKHFNDITADFPEFYSGAYLNDEREFIIQVTELNEDIIAYFGGIIDISDVVFEVVEYSYKDLLKEHDSIVEVMLSNSDDTIISNISGVGISLPDNSINLYIVISEVNTYSDDLSIEVKNKISSFKNINICPTSCKDSICSSVEPGRQIVNGSLSRSIGFWAYDENLNLGIVTAPHNNLPRGTAVYYSAPESTTKVVLGTAGTPYYGGILDTVFVKRTNSNLEPSRYVSGWKFNLISGRAIGSLVGSTIYSKGYQSGCQSGRISDISYTTSYGVSNCVLTTALAEGGDSGGLVAGGGSTSSRYVAGTITGKQNSTGYMIYVPITNILETFDWSVY